jgi:hypothetical protein
MDYLEMRTRDKGDNGAVPIYILILQHPQPHAAVSEMALKYGYGLLINRHHDGGHEP